MNAPTQTSDGPLHGPTKPKRAGRGGMIRNLLAIDEREAFLMGAQTTLGRLMIYIVAVTAISTYFPWWESILMVSAAMAAAYFPIFRNRILFTTTWVAVFLEMGMAENHILDDVQLILTQEHISNISALTLASSFLLLVMGGAWSALNWVRHDPKCFLARRPLIALLLLEFLLCGLTSKVRSCEATI